nr:hypothetical protein [Pyrinomonadaceae bacterium]
MLTKIFSLALIVTLLCTPVAARGDGPPPVEEIKARVIKRGTGERARVNVKLMDGTKLKGYISEAGEESFVLTDAKTKQTTKLAYTEVKEVKGRGLSRAAKIGIGVGIGVGAAAVVVGLAFRNFEIFPRR